MGGYEKSDFELVEERNGFEIRQHPESYHYYVFLPQYEAVYITDFLHVGNARDFCDEEDPAAWENWLDDRMLQPL
ncbi:hypothetical protein E2R60_05095 [Paenibacillus dendritiformis]|uniref:hypothetical protein n=1 Tax=Paenibacillus dendritiformis TaxID=130049 RepID=UPI00105A73CC|nr:hypothetical protein [Paenibacillus dendritiformis]TDL57855.1 hypothetical protein E2R60_05095 [Paenibacillus dendritiformis]